MEDRNSTRCKACDKLFDAVWREEHECFEELCWECLASALDFNSDYADNDPESIESLIGLEGVYYGEQE